MGGCPCRQGAMDETEDDADEPGMADDESLGVERGSSVVE